MISPRTSASVVSFVTSLNRHETAKLMNKLSICKQQGHFTKCLYEFRLPSFGILQLFSNLSESLMYYIHSTALQTIRFPLGWTERLFNVVENSWHCNAYL